MPTETYCVGPPRSIVTDHYLLDSISASMHAIDCVKRVLLMINNQPYGMPLAALFIGGVLPAVLSRLIIERSWLYEIKAPSLKQQATLDSWLRII